MFKIVLGKLVKLLGKEEKKTTVLPKKKILPVRHKKLPPRKSPEQKRLLDLLDRLRRRERALDNRLRALEERERFLHNKEVSLARREKEVRRRKAAVEKLQKEEEARLVEIANLKQEEARKLVIENTEKKLVTWVAKKTEEAKEVIKTQEEELAREILLDSIRHGVVDWPSTPFPLFAFPMKILKVR